MLVKTVSLTIYQPVDVNDGSGLFALGVYYGNPQTIKGSITPMSQEASYKETGIACSRPHLLITYKDNKDLITPASLVTWGTRQFKVTKPCSLFDLGTPADNANTVLEELDYANY